MDITQGGTGATTAAGARAALELGTGSTTNVGTIATQNANAVAITGGNISGISPLGIASGGTGASDPGTARALLGAASTSITITGTNGLTGGGDLSASRTIAIATNSNGFGIRTVSTAAPVGGSDGDIWYQV